MTDAKPLLGQFLTEDDFHQIPLAIATAYKGCNDLMRLNVVTSSFPIGIEQKPFLLRAFVDHALYRLADHQPGFFQETRWNHAHNCQHVRIYKGKLAFTAHFMGRNNFRQSARQAVNRAPLAHRNYDLFGAEGADLDVFKDGGYVQILHGGNASPAFILMAIPTRDQRDVGAVTSLTIPTPNEVAAEQIKDEMEFNLRKRAAEGFENGEATG